MEAMEAMKSQRIFGIVLAGLLSFIVVMLTRGQAVRVKSIEGQGNNLTRAVQSYDALQKYFYLQDGSSLYLEQYPKASGDNPYSDEWSFSQAHIAILDLSTVRGGAGRNYVGDLADREIGQERYWNTTGARGLAGDSSH